MKYYLNCLKKYGIFSGRARRKEYWMFTLFNAIIGIMIILIETLAGNKNQFLSNIYAIAIFVPGLSVTIRRLHDIGKSGWYYLFPLLCSIIGLLFMIVTIMPSKDSFLFMSLGVIFSLVGGIYLLILLCTKGDQGKNEYGEDPIEVEATNNIDETKN